MRLAWLAFLLCLTAMAEVRAQSVVRDSAVRDGSQAGQSTGEPVVIGINRHRFLTFDRDVETVFTGAPGIAWIDMQSRRRMVIQGKALGRIGLIVLDRENKELLNTVIAVVPDEEATVSVVRGGRNISEESLFCGGGRCVTTSNETKASSAAPGAGDAGSGGGSGGGAGGATAPESGGGPAPTSTEEGSYPRPKD